MNEEIDKYKNYPEGGGKGIYDMYYLQPQEYLYKYKDNFSLERWHTFYEKYIIPLLNINDRTLYAEFLYKMKPPFVVNFNKFDSFFMGSTTLKIEDEELLNFMAFLYSILKFEKVDDFIFWISGMKFLNSTLFEIIEMENGIEFIKNNLREISILNHG